jgi:hypothetical protein
MSKDTKLMAVLGAATLIVLVGGTALANKAQPPTLEQSSDAHAEVLGESSHDWEQIDINGGSVEKVFQIKNTGSSDLEVTNFKTSCMCTEVQVTIAGKYSPVFGMHTSSGWRGVVKPNETADVVVGFDPMFHGPGGVGPITRMVSFNTNDKSNPTIEFQLSGNVVKEIN